MLPQNRDDWVSPKSAGQGALRIDFTSGVQSPVKLRIGSKYQPLSSNNLKEFVIYVSDIVFNYSGLDAQATIDRKSEDVTRPSMRRTLQSVDFLRSAKLGSVKYVVEEFFSFVDGLDDELLTQLGEMDVFSDEQIQSIHAQAVGTLGGGFSNRLSAQKRAIMDGADIKDMQREFNSLLTKEYPKLLGPIEESKEITTSSDEDDSKRHLYIAMGIAGVLMLGFVIGRRRDRI